MSSEKKALVGVVVGSQSDLSRMEKTSEVLNIFKVPYEVSVLSAHRLPDKVAGYAKTAESRGLKALIAGAGMANHLAGALAARCVLPVIGVPLSGSALNGLDALFSVVQMPKGVPVAAVAIDGAANAAYLAVEILALSDVKLKERLQEHRKNERAKLECRAVIASKGSVGLYARQQYAHKGLHYHAPRNDDV